MKTTQHKPAVMTAKMKLPARLRLLGILPPQGGLATIRLVRDLRERLSLAKREAEGLEVQQGDGTITWNAEKDREKEFSFSGFEIELIVASLRKIEKEERLTPDLLALWDQFVDGAVPREGSPA